MTVVKRTRPARNAEKALRRIITHADRINAELATNDNLDSMAGQPMVVGHFVFDDGDVGLLKGFCRGYGAISNRPRRARRDDRHVCSEGSTSTSTSTNA